MHDKRQGMIRQWDSHARLDNGGVARFQIRGHRCRQDFMAAGKPCGVNSARRRRIGTRRTSTCPRRAGGRVQSKCNGNNDRCDSYRPTARADAPGNVLLTSKQTGLPKDSVVNVSQLFTVDKVTLTARVSILSGPMMRKVDDGLARVLEL